MAGEAHQTRNHEEIRRWVEERGGHPATVARTEHGDQAGVLRIDFPGYSGGGSLQPISWEEFFDKFDRNHLEFLYQDRTASGEPSRFNKLVSASTAERRGSSRSTGTPAPSRRATSTRRASSSRKSASASKLKSKSGSRTTKRSTARRGTARKTTRSASAGTRRGTSTARRGTSATRRRTRRTETEEPLIIGIVEVEAEPTPTDEVIRLEDEGPITGGGPSVTEVNPRHRERGTGAQQGGTHQR